MALEFYTLLPVETVSNMTTEEREHYLPYLAEHGEEVRDEQFANFKASAEEWLPHRVSANGRTPMELFNEVVDATNDFNKVDKDHYRNALQRAVAQLTIIRSNIGYGSEKYTKERIRELETSIAAALDEGN